MLYVPCAAIAIPMPILLLGSWVETDFQMVILLDVELLDFVLSEYIEQ